MTNELFPVAPIKKLSAEETKPSHIMSNQQIGQGFKKSYCLTINYFNGNFSLNKPAEYGYPFTHLIFVSNLLIFNVTLNLFNDFNNIKKHVNQKYLMRITSDADNYEQSTSNTNKIFARKKLVTAPAQNLRTKSYPKMKGLTSVRTSSPLQCFPSAGY